MIRIVWTKTARRDLEHVHDYIAIDSPKSAAQFVERIIAHVGQLSTYPQSGRIGRVDKTWELVVTGLPYIVPYRLKGDTVQILRVYHTSRLWPETL